MSRRPIESTFLQTTLEKCLGHRVEMTLLFDYLDDIIHHPSQQESLTSFITKWKAILHKSCPKTMIVKYSGTWAPNCLAPGELLHQQSWKDFVLKYDSSFSGQMIDSESSPEYQPLNFRELIKLTFWKELYDTFGHQIVSHVFEKCAVLYEIDSGFYLTVAYPGGLVHQRLSKYESFVRPASISRCGVSSSTTSSSRNPYEVAKKLENANKPSIGVSKSVLVGGSKPGHRKRKEIEEDAVREVGAIVPEPPAKKQKIASETDSEKHNSCASRWIKPKPDVIKKLISHRDSLINSHGLKVGASGSYPSAISRSSGDSDPALSSFNYVHIQKDENFKAKNKQFVIKQRTKISTANPKLPGDWQGLKFDDNLKKQAGGQDVISVTVYHISELLAKQLGIRLKPKGRSRRKRSGHQDTLIPVSSICSSVEVTPIDPSKFGMGQLVFAEPMNHEPSVMSDAKKISPFISSITLPISSCLYNRSSWSSWPATHCLSQAASELSTDKSSSLRKMVDNILKIPTCSENAYKYLMQTITEKWTDIDKDSVVLNKAIFTIVHAHVQYKDIHRLVKSCALHWRSKFTQKEEKRKARVKGKRESTHDAVSCEDPTVIFESPPLISIGDSPIPAVVTSQNSRGMSVDLFEKSQPSVIMLTSTSSGSTCFPPRGPTNSILDFRSSDSDWNTAKTESQADCVHRKKPALVRKCSGNSRKRHPFKSLKYPVSHNCLMQTVKQIFLILKLESLLGSKRNIRAFFTFVRKAIILGGAKSSLHLGELMALITPQETPFAQVCGGDQLATEIFVAKCVTWLFNDYVLVLLKTSFYITECSNTRFHLKFFLRESWSSASHKMRTRLLREGALKDHQQSSSQKRANAIIRHIPKANHTLRSLLIRKKTAWSITEEEQNKIKLLLHFLDAKIGKSRMQLPCTIQNEWRKFSQQWKEMGSPKLYYVRADIRDAFPSVSAEKLGQILHQSAGDRERHQEMYQKQYMLFCGNGRKVVRSSLMDSYCRSNWRSGIHVRPCIALDLNRDKSINIWKILDNLTTMIASPSTVKIGKKLYDFQYGLPQGWGPSSVLCSIYYGYIDSTLYIPYIETDGRLFLRVVDDYLFITPVANEVLNLMQLIKIGCEKYGVKINEDKSETNIYVRSDIAVPDTNCERITFCGWKFCITCGHVSRDYEKYKGQDFSSTVTFQMIKNISSPEQFIRLRGTLIMPARLKPILMDPGINCSNRILLTLYEASVLLGFRFYALCRVVYPTLNAISDPERAKSLFDSIRVCCARLARCVVRNWIGSSSLSSSEQGAACVGHCCAGPGWKDFIESESQSTIHPAPTAGQQISFNYHTLLYTSLRGFRLKLLNHFGVFKDEILPEINRSIYTLERKLGKRHCEAVLKIVGTEMPACFRDITV